MKKSILVSAAVLFGTAAYAQSAIDAYRFSQPDMKGTARFMGMAGAFGALGGDLSTLSHNPGGIGVYRNSDVGFTLDLDLQHAESNSQGMTVGTEQTKFLLNNIGFVWTLKLPSNTMPNFNIGFTYNKSTSFNRRYRGTINLSNSLSNFDAALTTQDGYSVSDLAYDDNTNFDPYNAENGAPWLSVLGYNTYLFSPAGKGKNPYYIGQWDSQTSGLGYFDVLESGAVDSYNIAFGGNIANVVSWGMDFDITHLNYNINPIWTEDLDNALVGNDEGGFDRLQSTWKLNNLYNCSGTGFNYKLGFIIKPVHEFRIGLSFETPTWYSLTETYSASLSYLYGTDKGTGYTNDGIPAYDNMNFRTPWKFNIAAAAVLLNRLILSAEYEWTGYSGMKFSQPNYWGWGGGYPPYDDPYFPPYDDPWDPWYYSSSPAGQTRFDPYISDSPFYEENQDIQTYYRHTNTFRIGAEFRVVPQFSIRAGYCFVSSPVKPNTSENNFIYTSGTMPNYRFDNTTNYVTAGLGYNINGFYVDLAYVYKHMSSQYHAYSNWWNTTNMTYPEGFIPSPTSSLSLCNSQIVLSAGFKF